MGSVARCAAAADEDDCPIAPPLSDADIRPALMDWIFATLSGANDALLLEELGFCRGQVRVDLALVGADLHGFEIKSERDSLARLASQAETYSRVLDRATLVVGERHLAEALLIVPSWWGILRVSHGYQGPEFSVYREAKPNPNLDPRSLVELLWLEDSLELLEQRGCVKGLRGKPRRVVWDRVSEVLAASDIAAAVRDRLRTKARTRGLRQPPSGGE